MGLICVKFSLTNDTNCNSKVKFNNLKALFRYRESVRAFYSNVYFVYLPVCSLRLSHTQLKRFIVQDHLSVNDDHITSYFGLLCVGNFKMSGLPMEKV